MAQTINIQRLWDQKYRDESVPFPIDGTVASTTYFDVKDYGAVGNGVTDDTTAIQAALDAAGAVQGTVLLSPPPAAGYVVSNLKMTAQTRLIGSGMSACHLLQKTGATGIVLREKTGAEGNASGAGGVWVTDLGIIGNNVAGDGLDLGNVSGSALNFNAGVQRVYVQGFPAGTGIRINGNAIQCQYLWSNLNATGIQTLGGGNSWVGLWAESNTTEAIRIGTSGDSYFHIQTEGDGAVLPINITGNDNLVVRPYCAVGPSNATHIIKCSTGSNRNHILGAYLSQTGGFTFSNLIYSEVLGLGTGPDMIYIPEWFDRVPIQKPQQGSFNPTYGPTVNINVAFCQNPFINVTNGTAFTIANPSGAQSGYRLMIDIYNNTAGAMGTITWGNQFLLAGAFTNPASHKRRTIEFYWDTANWVEIHRAAADI